jgi:hypothetical protein
MTRLVLILVASLSVATAPATAKTVAYEDNKLNFKSCEGENVSARWFGASLSLSQAGKSPTDPVPSVKFLTWDGTCGSFQWNADVGALVVKLDDETLPGKILNFVAWDGSKWSAARTGAGFYVARIADQGEANPKRHMKTAGEWVAKNNKLGVPAADILAEELAAAAASGR